VVKESAYLVRHAKAEQGSPGGDAARRLTREGRDRFRRQLDAIAGQLRLRRIVTSPYARAVETAELLSEATGAPVEQDVRLASGASGGRELLRLAAELGPGTALVGHNPEVAEAIHLAGDQEAAVPPGSVAAVGADGRLAWLRPG
jgi:phosphohistidine phosphatase